MPRVLELVCRDVGEQEGRGGGAQRDRLARVSGLQLVFLERREAGAVACRVHGRHRCLLPVDVQTGPPGRAAL